MRMGLAIIFVKDMDRSVAFYRDVIGLTLKFASPHWTEFATEGATLALHVSENPEDLRDDPGNLPAGRCRPGFAVPDIAAFHQRMVDAGVPCAQEPKDVFGTMVAQYVDPDGLAFGISQEPE